MCVYVCVCVCVCVGGGENGSVIGLSYNSRLAASGGTRTHDTLHSRQSMYMYMP